MTKRILFVDAQVFQGDDWNRGTGKYSFNIVNELTKHSSGIYSKIIIILNKNIATGETIKQKLKEISAIDTIFLDLKRPLDLNDQTPTSSLESHNKAILTKELNKLTKKKDCVDFLILSLFASYSYSVFPDFTNNLIIGYDIIPFLYSVKYRQIMDFSIYFSKFRTIFEADRIFTISQTTANDFMVYIGIDSNKLCNISGAPITDTDPEVKQNIVQEPNETHYILMPSGDDLRKNNDNMVLGFERYRINAKDKKLKLLITSNFSQQSKDRLNKLSDNIEFLGNVKSENLAGLYAKSLCVLFVPEYEGLGLPVLEAIRKYRPVVCSDLNVFKEISNDSFYFVDQFSTESIAEGINNAIRHTKWEDKRSGYSSINEAYTWDNVISKMIKSASKIGPKIKKPVKKRIAIFCPNPLGYSAIGRVVMRQHATLSEYFEIDYYIEDDDNYIDSLNNVSFLDQVANVYKANVFTQDLYRRYLGVFYHIGNGYYHLESIKNALYLPGIVIIHDTNIELGFKGMYDKKLITKNRLKAEEALNKFDTTHKTSFLTSITNAQRAIVVHSDYAKEAIKNITKDVKVYKLELPVGTPLITRDNHHNKLRVGIAGILNSTKGVFLLEQMASIRKFHEIDFCLFGFSMLSQNELIDLTKHPNIKLVTNLVEFEFQSLLESLDIIINYRTQYNGETSLTVLESMRFGVVPVVKNEGWYGEIPQSSVVSVDNTDDLLDILSALINNKNLLNKISKNAIVYTRTQHTYGSYSFLMDAVLNDISTNKHEKSLNYLIESRIKHNKLTTKNIIELITNQQTLSRSRASKYKSRLKYETKRIIMYLKTIDNKLDELLSEKTIKSYEFSEKGLSKREVYNRVLYDFNREQAPLLKRTIYRLYVGGHHLAGKYIKKIIFKLRSDA